jgi:prophage tail gpP-like protein
MTQVYLPAKIPTRRIALKIDGKVIDRWTRVELVHDMGELAASFELTVHDDERAKGTWEWTTPAGDGEPMNWGRAAEITIDGETWLKGWIDDVCSEAGEQGGGYVTISGRDKTGDLVDCPPDPRGKHEYKKIKLEEFAKKICEPFGIKVKCDVDTSPVLDKATVEAGETVISALAKYAKQRAVIITSDRVGGILITRSGKQKAIDEIHFPGNVTRVRATFSARERFSDYFVKGQSEKNGGRRPETAALNVSEEPKDEAPEQPAPATDSPLDKPGGAGAHVMGHAKDPDVTRWRPHIAMSRTQAKDVDAQKQAEWEMRTRRAKGDKMDYSYRGITGGPEQKPWQMNTVAFVEDDYAGLSSEQLIAGVSITYDERGEMTRLRVTGREAFDLLLVGDRRSQKKSAKKKGGSKPGGLDSTAKPL